MLRAIAGAAVATLAVNACDLELRRGPLESSWLIDEVNADTDPCLQAENCLAGPGTRTVLRFDSHVFNIGDTDCRVGWTPQCPPSGVGVPDQPPFVFDTCHRHWHLTGFSEYALIDSSGTVVREGYKNGLCLMDVICGRQRYTCQDQGLSSGCGDIYDHKLNCQWIDITGLDLDQTYTFRWTANEERVISETDYTNNVVEVQVHPASVRRGHVYGAVAPNQCPLEGGEAQSVFMTTGSLTPGEPVNYEAYETPRERRRRERRERRERRRNRFSD